MTQKLNVVVIQDDIVACFENISSWEKMERVMNFILNFKEKIVHLGNHLHDDRPNKNGETEELMNIENLDEVQKEIIRLAKGKAFKEEIKSLTSTKIIPQSSSIYKLDQYIDDDGLIRVGGRLKKVDLDQDTAHPILLPKKSPTAFSIIK